LQEKTPQTPEGALQTQSPLLGRIVEFCIFVFQEIAGQARNDGTDDHFRVIAGLTRNLQNISRYLLKSMFCQNLTTLPL